MLRPEGRTCLVVEITMRKSVQLGPGDREERSQRGDAGHFTKAFYTSEAGSQFHSVRGNL